MPSSSPPTSSSPCTSRGSSRWRSCRWLRACSGRAWGPFAFLLNYVPDIGSILAVVPPILIALMQFGPQSALLVLVLVANLVVSGILGNVIEPRMMGQKVGLSTLTIFLGLIFWSWVLGPVGTVLSVPLTLVAKMMFESPSYPPESAPA